MAVRDSAMIDPVMPSIRPVFFLLAGMMFSCRSSRTVQLPAAQAALILHRPSKVGTLNGTHVPEP